MAWFRTTAVAMLVLVAPADAKPLVFANYPGYEFAQMPPTAIDFSVVDCVIHFSAKPNADGTLNFSAHQLSPARIQQMVALAHDNDACVLLTIGGANTRPGFLAPTATLVSSIVNAVNQYGYDGVDVDWEPLRDSDEAAFRSLISSLRQQLPADAMLTASAGYQFGTNESKQTAAIFSSVAGHLDYVHLMAYGLSGPWPGWVSWHSSALSNGGRTFPGTTKPLPSAQVMVEQYLDAGVPTGKLMLGLAFFGHSWTRVYQPRQAWTSTTTPVRSGEYHYWKIIRDFPSGHKWDTVSQTPYVGLNPAGIENDRFLPYENPRSIKAKRNYAATKGLAGLMIWELRGDHMPNGSHPLLNALR